MRFLLDQESYAQMRARDDHTPDCYVRPGEYLHHLYVDSVKYVVARALLDCMKEAQAQQDAGALQHLLLHKEQLDQLVAEAQQRGGLDNVRMLGDPPPTDEDAPTWTNTFAPPAPGTVEETGLNRSFIYDMILRTVYSRGRPTGAEIASDLRLRYRVIAPLLNEMRQGELLEVIGQRGVGDIGYEYVMKSPRGTRAVDDALQKTGYSGPTPVPFAKYVESVYAQTIKNLVVTRRNIRQAFSDLIITDAVLNEIGPAINSAASVFLFGFPGNGKTSVAERITRLMGDDIYIPYAVETDGQIIKVYDSIVHECVEETELADVEHLIAAPPLTASTGQPWQEPDADEPWAPPEEQTAATDTGALHDQRWLKIKRPVVVVGGELIMEMLDLTYNSLGKFYEAPLHMKANGGIFMIDDFGRQQVRPMDLLNRWIVPLEKRYDYLTTVTGNKIEIPFELLLIFSTNLDPTQLADEAFLRRIKFKIEIRDPDEVQWRRIWELVGKSRGVEIDHKGLDYLVEKWYKPEGRPFRMSQPRDILDQMMSIAKYNMEQVNFSPDLIDAACETYFVRVEGKDYGAAVRLD